MNIISFLQSDLVSKFVLDQDIIKLKQKQASFNLFTISSYNSYLENFHSDVVASLLNPNAPHNQSNNFLFLFLDYLNVYHGLNINSEEFVNSEVTREKGRLDIWIKNTTSRKAIIIENKINNAVDMDSQIDRYYEYVETINKYSVVAIVYLTIDGTKKAPPTCQPIKYLVKNVSAYTNLPSDLVNGWLKKCLKAANNQDSSTFLYQYIKLIKHLANHSMETNTMDEFYNFVSAENGLKTLDTIAKMYANLTKFRADKFSRGLSDYSPFKKQFRYKSMYWLYENYLYKGQKLKLDVWFEENGGAEVVFWNTTTRGINGRIILSERLDAIGMIQEFTDEVKYFDNGYSKHFTIGDQYKNMADLDQAVLEFVKSLMNKLNTH